MAGCVPCFVIPLLLFIFHRYIQPIILKFWNPWGDKQVNNSDKTEEYKLSWGCPWNKKKSKTVDEKLLGEETEASPAINKVKGL